MVDIGKTLEGAGQIGASLIGAAVTKPNSIKSGGPSQAFKDSKLNQTFYGGYGFIDGTMPYVDPPSFKQRAAGGVAGGMMSLISGLVGKSQENSQDAHPLTILSQKLMGMMGGGATNGAATPDINSPLSPPAPGGGGSSPFGSLMANVSSKFGIPEFLLPAIGTIESSMNPQARGKAGEQGMFQLMPATAKGLDKQRGGSGDYDLFDPETNANFAGQFLGTLFKKYGGDLLKVAFGYNRGEPFVDKYQGKTGQQIYDSLPASQRQYADKFLKQIPSTAGGTLR